MARALNTNTFMKSTVFLKSCKELYQNTPEEIAERYSSLTEGLRGDIVFYSSSGRAELVGNHTDHNHGFVLAATVDLDTVAAVTKQEKREITINSIGYPPVRINIDDTKVNDNEYGTSDALVRGVVKAFIDRGLKVGGFIANTSSNIFKGAGVSSSAAFELLLCEIFNDMFNDGKIDFVTKAIISQYAENHYFGKPSGLMDQLTISKGGVSFMDFEDIAQPKATSIEWNFKDISPVIINCGGDHSDLTHEYTEIKDDMKLVASALGKKVLREVAEKDFYDNIVILKKLCGGRAILRAKHFFEENERVKKALQAINNNDINSFLDCINLSGISSYQQLQNCYAKGDKEQNIPLGLHLAERFPNVLAKRVHGGGFAGTILVMIENKYVTNFVAYMQEYFGKENIFKLAIRNKGTSKVEV